MQRLTPHIVPVQDTVPDFLRRLGRPEQIPILRIDDTFVDEENFNSASTLARVSSPRSSTPLLARWRSSWLSSSFAAVAAGATDGGAAGEADGEAAGASAGSRALNFVSIE